MVNQERSRRGIGPVAINGLLVAAARNHSYDMAARQVLTHTGSDGSNPGDRIRAAGYPASTWGETAAAGYSTATSVMTGWMGSPAHRDNLLSPQFTEIGVGAVTASSGQIYWTMALASR
jgi:uncharacterized protein YkwD